MEDLNPHQQARVREQLAPRKLKGQPASPSKPASTTTPPTLSSYSPKSPSPVPVRNLAESKTTATERKFNDEILKGCGRFEAITLKLPGGSRYTPDWLFMDGDTPVLVETKGSYRLPSEGRAHTAFLEAAAHFPMFRFVWATQIKGGGWDLKYAIPASSEPSQKTSSSSSTTTTTTTPETEPTK